MSVRRYERGERIIPEETLERIATALEIPVELLTEPEAVFSFLQSQPEFLESLRVFFEKSSKGFKMLSRKKQDSIISLALRAAESEFEGEEKVSLSDNEALTLNYVVIGSCMEKLNAKGQQIAVERVEELTKIPDYQKADED